MPYNFDEEHYKKVFDQMFGAGAFNSDMELARKVGQSRAKVQQLKSQFNSLVKQRQQAIKNPKKTYQDAVDYWGANPGLYQGKGAYAVANDILNDPAKQAELKSQGYSVSDYINGLYDAASGGKFRSQREYNQYTGNLNKDIAAKDKAYKAQHNGKSEQQVYDMQQKLQKLKPKKKSNVGLLGNFGGLFKDLGHDVSQRAKGTGNELSNIFKAIADGPGGYKLSDVANNTQKTIKSQQKADAQRGFSSPLSKEVHRGANRAVDAAFLGNMSAYQNAENSKGYGFNTNYANTRQFGKGGATDFLTSGLGYLLPGNAAYKSVAGVGERVAGGLSKLSPKLANIAGKTVEGSAAGGVFGTMQSIADPNMSIKQRMANIGFNVAGGAVLDPLFHGLGAGIGRLRKGNPMPEITNAIKQEPLGLPAPKVAGYLNEGQKQLPPPMRLNEPMQIDQPSGPAFIQGVRREKNPYTVKFEQLVNDFNKLQSQGLIPPGREEEVAVEMWNNMAGPHDPSFEQMLHLANDRPMVTPQQKPELIQQARKNAKAPVYGIDNITNQLKLKQPMQRAPLQYTGKGFNPVLKVQQVPKEIPPLNFKKTVIAKNQPDLLQNIRQTLNPKMEVAATAENITPQRSNEPQLVRADSVTPSNNQSLLQGIDTANLKDIGGVKAYTSDVYRIFHDVFGKHFNQIKQRLLDPFDKAKGENVDLQKALVNQMDQVIIKKLGIKPGSKESALVQMFGEGEISLDELKQQAPTKWNDIVKADKWFHDQYDKLLNAVNAVRTKLYPNQPDKIVPARKDYYRHFKELNGLEGLKNLFDTPAGIDPHLAGTSEFTRPNSRYASFMQKRGKGPYKRDAVGGYLNYVPAATYAIKIDPFVKQFNQLANELADATTKTSHLNTFVGFLKDFSGDLAGKTNFLDRPLQKLLGRKTFHVLDWLNKRVKSNVILGNMSSALAQLANIPQGVAFAKQYSVKGATNTLKSILDNEKSPINASNFIKERYGHSIYSKFDTKWINQPKKFAAWTMEAVDKIGTSFVWHSAYEKGLAQKVANPIKYADDATRSLVAGRGIGEVPLAQKSKIVQLIAPFQLEVANLWRVQADFLKNKDIGGLLTLYLAAHLINKGMQSVRGNAVTFDPIQAIVDASSQSDLTPTERGGRLAGEILSNLPLGQTLANFYPEYGTKSLPTRKELFGRNDPNRFGSGLLIAKGVQDPLFKVASPYGGNQVEKTIKGIKAINNEGVYNKQKTQLNYPVSPNLQNQLKSVLFGPGAFKETQNYYNQNLRPLSVNQTKIYNENKKAGSGIGYYNLVQQNRVESNIKKVLNDTKLTNKQKDNKLQDLIKRLKALQAQ